MDWEPTGLKIIDDTGLLHLGYSKAQILTPSSLGPRSQKTSLNLQSSTLILKFLTLKRLLVLLAQTRWTFTFAFSSVQSFSHVWLFATPWTTAHQASLSIANSRTPPKPMSIELVMPSNHLILCHPLLLLPSIFPSIRVFSNKPALHIRWPKYWSFSFSITPSSEHPGLISFRMDWLDPLAVQGTLKSLIQHHSWKTSILQRSAFFIVQLWHHTWPLEKP